MIPAYLYYRHQKKKTQNSASVSRQMSLSPGSSLIDRVTFTAPGVAAKIGDDADEITYVPGVLTLVEKPHGIYIEWTPLDNVDDSTNEWVVTGSVDANGTKSAEMASAKIGDYDKRAEELKRLRFSADIKDLRSFQCVEPRRGKSGSPWIRLISKDGTNYIPLYFRDGGLPEFTEHLQQYATLKRSAKESNLILFTDERAEALQQSVSALFSREVQSDFMSRLMANPYATAMTGLGKVANFVQDQVLPSLILDMEGLDPEEQAQALKELQQKDENDAGDLRLHDDAGFELVTKLDLPERPAFTREPPLIEQQWNAHKSSDGRFKELRELKLLIFRGGLTPGLRCEAWKYLLNYYDWNATNEERLELRKKRVDDYFRMKLQWKSISEDQETRFGEFRDRKALVEKDVTRTDRTHRFFEGDHNANVSMLSDILMTYCMYNFDLGYVQGMSDCLSPILVVMENEVDAFWAFVGLMDRMYKNFEMDQKHIRNQLMQLRDLLMIVNPRLANYLESHQSDNMYFCFRWVLIQFKREFSFSDIMRLWEVLWTDLPCENFHLLMCVAILDKQMNFIIENKFGLTEILKHVNDLSTHIDLEQTLTSAEAIYHQLAASQDKLPRHICAILGMHVLESTDGPSSSREGSPVKTPAL